MNPQIDLLFTVIYIHNMASDKVIPSVYDGFWGRVVS